MVQGLKKDFWLLTKPKLTPFPRFPGFYLNPFLQLFKGNFPRNGLLGELSNPLYWKLEIPKSYQVFSNFKKRVLNPAYKELKEKGDYYFEYELSNREKSNLS